MKNYSLSIKSNLHQILLAPNAFKGTLRAIDFCHILSEELQDSQYNILSYPMCDGGDGTAKILASYLRAKPTTYLTVDALGRPHETTYYITNKTAVVELADVCGLQHIHPKEYDIYNASTAGLGEVLYHLSLQDINHIILGVGGSASIDGGLGAFRKMGLAIQKYGENFNNHLIELENIKINQLKDNFKHIKWTILCDVDNHLCGKEGAAVTFGPQKGATPKEVEELDKKLYQYATLLDRQFGVEILSLKHGGAAGGIAATFKAFFNAELLSGAEFCLHLSGFKQDLPNSQLVITGEGKLDAQSLHGKLPGIIASHCQILHIPIIGIAGSIERPIPTFDQLYSFMDYAPDLVDAMQKPEFYLRQIAKDLKRNVLK